MVLLGLADVSLANRPELSAYGTRAQQDRTS